ncbi:PAAR domain-containing protein [Thiolinea disciformis]|uniref:PAAR domain-containing protein n=1 Tax=Thiolinea disciformis TaxID=125614 RepID=UPI0003714D7C|nr:PAAR domain-containing protein [Thiolinea disciformis]
MSAAPPLPKAPEPYPPTRPTNALHTISQGISSVVGAPQQLVEKFEVGFAKATSSIAAVFPSMPAATLMSLTLGLPHAHVAHPPSGPPPIPPTPLPPMGPVTAGVSIQVLINGMPAARCGDIILNPTCCGILPLGEIKTGSSNVFIGGARAARQLMDITMHCPVVNSAGNRAQATAQKAQQAAEQVSKLSKAIAIAGKVMQVGGIAAQGLAIAGDVVESVESDNAAMSAALAQNAAMMAAQMAADAAAMALAAAMGKDPAAPPGTPGTIITPGAVNVIIGGFPMIATMALAKGLMNILKGLLKKRGQGKPNASVDGQKTCNC